ncbi:aspartate racemase/maleate isomerase family protein [Mesorhizobium sp. ArgA1]
MKGIGLITLSTDPVGEDAFKAEMAGSPVRVFTTRTSYDEADHKAGGFIPIPDWPTLLATLPPGNLVDLIAFACTSATIALGNEALLHHLSSARSGLRYTSPGIAAVAMMQRFEIKRIALLTPYGPALHDAFAPYFADYGIQVVAGHSLSQPMNLSTDDDIARVPLDRIQTELEALLAVAGPVDALFVSCAAFSIGRSDLARLRGALGCTVLASVNSMAWHALDLLGEHRLRDKMTAEIGFPRAAT